MQRIEGGKSWIHRRAIATAEEVRLAEIKHAQDIMGNSGMSIKDQKAFMETANAQPIDPQAEMIEDCTLVIDNLVGVPTEINCAISTGPFGQYNGSYSIQQKVH